MARKHLTLTVAVVVCLLFAISYLLPTSTPHHATYESMSSSEQPAIPLKEASSGSKSEFQIDLDVMPVGILEGESIAPKLENATLKAELGRSTWKFLHTMMARFPEEPTANDRMALETFIHLFSRLYPCGDCAKHFRQLLAEYPPQTSSRNAAAGWLCFAHNIVNERLHKEIFDCNNIGDFYDCGCGDDDKKKEVGDGEGAAKDADANAEDVDLDLRLE